MVAGGVNGMGLDAGGLAGIAAAVDCSDPCVFAHVSSQKMPIPKTREATNPTAIFSQIFCFQTHSENTIPATPIDKTARKHDLPSAILMTP
jgi:hypothetical protein